MNIKIKKTNFLARIQKNENNLLLGSNGKISEDQEIDKSIPFIFGDFEIENFFDLKKAIDETSFNYDDIKNLYYFKSGRWDIELKDKVLIKLPANNIKESLEITLNFLLQDSENLIKKIDLRQTNQAIINER